MYMVENPKTVTDISVGIADDFHNDIDSDDPCDAVTKCVGGVVEARFESGRQFRITVEQL